MSTYDLATAKVFVFPDPDGTNYTNYRSRGVIGTGSFGTVYATNDPKVIIKEQRMVGALASEMRVETDIQKALYEAEPGVCPEVFNQRAVYGQTPKYVVAMERYDDTARNLLSKSANPEYVLQYLEQIAAILKRLEKYEFNHRDLKSDNVMYRMVDGKPKFVLVDFGFSCATVKGVTYTTRAYSYSKPARCFLKSRDLGHLVYELLRYVIPTQQGYPADLREFLQLVLTFDIQGKKCEMYKGCPPHDINRWADTYDFLNDESIENPNTTPEGLIRAVKQYREHGIQACRQGFIVNPMTDTCVPKPPPVPKPKGKAETPKAAAAPGAAPCPPGKLLNPKTRRCVKETGAIGKALAKGAKTRRSSKPKAAPAPAPAGKPCPPGKLRNPATGRCVNETGAIGKKLLGN